MRIRFSNYKKIYILLGGAVFLLGSFYVVSEIVNRNRNKTGNKSKTRGEIVYKNITSPQNITGTGGITAEQMTSLAGFLSSKTELVANSYSNSSVDFRDDPVFENIDKVLLERVNAEMQKYNAPIRVEFRKVIIYSNGRLGKIDVVLIGNLGKSSSLLEFVYSQDVENKWKLVDFIVEKSF